MKRGITLDMLYFLCSRVQNLEVIIGGIFSVVSGGNIFVDGPRKVLVLASRSRKKENGRRQSLRACQGPSALDFVVGYEVEETTSCTFSGVGLEGYRCDARYLPAHGKCAPPKTRTKNVW